jgi:hypothetical protein
MAWRCSYIGKEKLWSYMHKNLILKMLGGRSFIFSF